MGSGASTADGGIERSATPRELAQVVVIGGGYGGIAYAKLPPKDADCYLSLMS